MKKILSILLCLCLALSLVGCGGGNEETTADTSVATTALPTDTIEYTDYEEPLIAVAVPHITESVHADDGTCIFTYTNQDMVLTMDDGTVADIITADFLARNDFSDAAQSVLDAAKATYNGQADWSNYFYQIYYSPVRLDSQILSLLGSEIVYNGSPRSIASNLSVNYDLLTGKALTLKDVLVAGYEAEDLVKLIVEAVKEYSEQGILFTDYEYIITDLFSTNVQMDRWYFTDNALCFFFTPYEIAPNMAGTVIAEIPYSALTGLLKDEYFPPESIPYSGALAVTVAGESDLNSFEFTEVILNNQGQEYVITPQGTALNVRLSIGLPDDESTSFQPRYIVYAATAVTEGQAILLQCTQEDLAALRISYNNTSNQTLTP